MRVFRILRLIVGGIVRLIAVLSALRAALWIVPPIIGVMRLDLNQPFARSLLYVDRDGTRLSPAGWLPLRELPRNYIYLLIAREDERFLTRQGPLDAWAIARALVMHQGASTIPMQVARCAYELPGGSFPTSFSGIVRRKILEIILAERLCAHFSPAAILELYVNYADFAGYQGLRSAARAHFGREPGELTPEQMLWLYATLPAPTARRNHRSASALLREALEHLKAQGRLEANVLIPRRPAIPFSQSTPNRMPNSVLAPSWEAEFARPLTGLKLDAPAIVHLAVDFRLQRNLQTITADHIEMLSRLLPPALRDQLDTGLVAVENGTADVLAIIPGANPSSEYSNATQAVRDVGSAFKTLTLASCLEDGSYQLDTTVDDAPLAHAALLTAPDYEPRDYDGQFLGPIALLTAFARSRNLPFVELGEKCRARLTRLLDSVELPPLKPWRSAYLGAYATTVLNLAGAYASFANGGVFREPTIVREVQDSVSGAEVVPHAPQQRPAVSEKTASEVLQAMRAAAVEGTAHYLGQAGLPGGAKTGTTSGIRDDSGSTPARDLWVVYSEPRFTMAMWVGRRDAGNLWPAASSASILPFAAEAIEAVQRVEAQSQ